MNEFAVLVCWVLVALMIFQVPFTFNFVSLLRLPNRGSLQNDPMFRATVILCLRGGDPFLPDCLRALLNQNYPCYEVRIVVDSREDPAWEIVAQTLQNQAATHVQVSPLVVRRQTCSLKCSALVQAVSQLDDSCEVVALVDADTVPHPNWLRELVTPLADGRVGATTGNRWYMPAKGQWGSLLRYLWNATAVVQMYFYVIPWGGSLALKTELLRRTQLLEKWGQALSEDVLLYSTLREQGLQIKFVPSLMMVNREECDISSFVRWEKRQLILARLYHPQWWGIVAHVILTTLILALAVVMLLAALVTRQWEASVWVSGGLAVYMTGAVLFLGSLEQSVRRVIQDRGELTTPFTATVMAKILLVIPLVYLVHMIALVSSILTGSVEWRGITYQIKNPWNIRLVEYHPYQTLDQAVDTKASL